MHGRERPIARREIIQSVGQTNAGQVVAPPAASLKPPAVQIRGQTMPVGGGGNKNIASERNVVAFGHINPADRMTVTKPEINNRVLDITAIQQQPKLL